MTNQAHLTEDAVGAPAPIRVMLVDDHQLFAQSLVRALSQEPSVDVVAAVGSVAAALALQKRIHPDVVLMDIWLPDGDGITLAARMRKDPAAPKVLFLTGVDDDRLLVRAIESGCSGVLTKTLALSELVRAVNAVARGDIWMPPSLLAQLLPRLHGTPGTSRQRC